MKEAFVYRWRETTTGRWYIGFHKGTATDGYICSSNQVKPLIQARPYDWSRKILRWGTKQQMVALEHKILKQLDARRNPQSYNMSISFPYLSPNVGRKKGNTKKVTRDAVFKAIKQATGREYIELLAENYWQVVWDQDKKLIAKYHKLFNRHWGPLWFEKLGIMDAIKRLTEFKS
jgi:hypothetical protein